MKPHIFRPEAREEYIQAVQYYSDVRPELGARLYQEIERLIHEWSWGISDMEGKAAMGSGEQDGKASEFQIRREPGRFFQFSPPARRALARRFPYSVIYLEEPERVWIVAVMHAKRRPEYWHERLR